MSPPAIALTAAVACALVPAVVGAAPQAYVQSDGLDSNTRFECKQVAPCRTLAAAITVVDDHGEIVAVDAADYGALGIDRSVTVSESLSSGNAVGFANIPGTVGIGTFETFGDNVVSGNGIAATGFVTAVPKM